jgi:hypothetical protein
MSKQRLQDGTDHLIRRSIALSAALLALVGAAPAALAEQSADGADYAATAEALFQQGKAAMAMKRFAEACPKLAESQRLDPGGGTLLTLALCHEGEGRTASAWAEFNEALAVAKKDGREDREKIARQRAAALEPKLSRIVVRVPTGVARTAALRIARDGLSLGPPLWGVAAPVDPGFHRITADAPGKNGWSVAVTVGANGDTKEVEVPPLSDMAPAPHGLGTRRIASLVMGGVGLGVLGASTYLGVRALANQREADGKCPEPACTDHTAVDLNADARTSAHLATAGFVVGGAAVGTAVLLWVLAPTRHASSWRASPWIGPGTGGTTVTASF